MRSIISSGRSVKQMCSLSPFVDVGTLMVPLKSDSAHCAIKERAVMARKLIQKNFISGQGGENGIPSIYSKFFFLSFD